ncbi:rodhanase family domain containing protein [Entamoeba histolytica HM-1:IMSS-B]|uniref:protein-tyrosine-phosphatase n=6 Tax=Entamoeba histolytica TaxID=5759 RepID=C4M8D2_ENTH1|nr:rodhanase-like domain containing protein [Entamoeba histolytica HM-1:IMSS]EMD43476.1 rodhanase family protein, putative [Entamoeba histolytica KU27]EMH73397.1 rodhanase family domain containing protein [Entamoeba histolytica HM-1:IMSS-B]EMS13584.1 rodhanase family domain containing protein [Entamoeba histolytica HM-3:IMSS]ENY63448.1 rodhanase family domain containing protein [Entamoeba histolytica HM-1:IMSS-A]GAT97859.1 rodhanase-like domain containing protein [Entamoeba histolytica]|eukprot:XP_649604.1 rodhanase-like domain containing protein [Entamoeba histolytica HM-1:IMSS]
MLPNTANKKRDVMKKETEKLIESPKNPCLFSRIFSLNFDNPYNLIEPYFLHQLLFSSKSKLYLFDCRYDYEYEGGHIYSAVPCPSKNELETLFFIKKQVNVIIVFHCEYSQNRGPNQWLLFRQLDREKNKDQYPLIWYPDVFVLNGGYRYFYHLFPECCGGYIRMEDRPFDTSDKSKPPVKISCCRRLRKKPIFECSPIISTRRVKTM